MSDIVLELLLPSTDQANYVQWLVALAVWVAIFWFTRQWGREPRIFVLGLFTVNVAWFFLRAVH